MSLSSIVKSVTSFVSNPIGTTLAEASRFGSKLENTFIDAGRDIINEVDRLGKYADKALITSWKYTESYASLDEKTLKSAFAGAVLFGQVGAAAFAVSSKGNTDMPVLKELDSFLDGISGVKNEEQAKIAEYGKLIEALSNKYSDEADRLMAFDEIFFMALKNKYKPTIESMNTEYNKMLSDYESYYGWIDNLQGTFLGKIAYTAIAVTGGLSQTLQGAASGNWDDIKQVISIGVQVGIIVLLMLIPSGVSQTAAVTMIIALLHQLQQAYANSAITRMIFEMLDYTFDITGLNQAIPELTHFDKDSDYYEETIGHFNLATTVGLAVATIALGNVGAFDNLANQGSALFGEASTQLGQAYTAYNIAISVGDMYEAYKQLGKMKEDLQEKKDKLVAQQQADYRKKMLSQSRDVEYILEGYEQMVLNNYAGLESGDKIDVFDPSATIPMNTRYRLQAEVTYGYEDVLTMFDESKFGSNILYGKF